MIASKAFAAHPEVRDMSVCVVSRNSLSRNVYGCESNGLPRENRVESDVAAGATNTERPLPAPSEYAERG